jgi:aldose 1-epimerase
MRAAVRASKGGRVAALWREEPRNRRTDVVVPLPDGDYDPLAWPKAGIYPLVPWSNRIRNAQLQADGGPVALRPHPACAPHALHGFAHELPWEIVESGADCLSMSYVHAPDQRSPGVWPWPFRAVQRLSLDGAGLTLELSVTNTGDKAMPAGLGVHPFLAAAPGDRLRFTADTLWPADADGCGHAAVALTAGEARHDAVLGQRGDTRFFAGFGGIASLARGDGSRVVIETGAPFDHLVLHVPDGTPYACIEPVTHVADAFNLAAAGVQGTGARILQPGDTLAGLVRLGLA